MKVLAFTVLHYGKEYLKYSIESVRNSVDAHYIAYTALPSFGYTTHLKNPDTREELKAICDQFAHVIWDDVQGINQENAHRQKAIDYARNNGFDIILVVDYDEVWKPELVNEAIEAAYNSKAGNFLVSGNRWVTLWKSFNEYVTDGFAPVRLFNLKNNLMQPETIEKGFIYHMGYCISDELMAYKISCHGHRADFVRNNAWFEHKWKNYQRGITKHLHPATDAYWYETNDFDKTHLPDILKAHPYYK